MTALYTYNQKCEFDHNIDAPEFRQDGMRRRKFAETRQADQIHKGFERKNKQDEV